MNPKYSHSIYICMFVCVWGFDGIHRGNYFGGEPIGRAEVEVRVGRLRNGKAVGEDEITGEMIKGRGDVEAV